jgi:hypothetical protein
VLESAEKIFNTLEEQGGLRLTISGRKIAYQVAITVQGEKSLTYTAYLFININQLDALNFIVSLF